MEMLVDIFITGLTRGMIYALLALGFVVIYKTSLVLNLAQGEIVFLLAIISYEFTSVFQLPFWLALILILVLAVFLAQLINWFVIRPLLDQPIISVIMATIALGFVLRGIIRLKWIGSVYMLPAFLGDVPIRVGSVVIERTHCFSVAICATVMILLTIFFQKTKQGLGMRATAEEMQTSRSLGVNVKVILSIAWGISCAIAGFGAFALGTITGVSGGIPNFGLSAIAVAILGGVDSLKGAVIAGIIMGFLESLASMYLDPLLPSGGGLASIFPFMVMLLVLLFKPYGLFGLVKIERI